MKLIFSSSLIIVILLSIIITARTLKKENIKNPLTGLFRRIVIACIICSIANIGITYSPNYLHAEIMYSIYYSSVSWLCFFLVHFLVTFSFPDRVHPNTVLPRISIQNVLAIFTENGKKNSSLINKIFLIISFFVTADTLIIMTNSFHHKVFSTVCQYCYSALFGNDWFFLADYRGYFEIHLSLSYFILALGFITLIVKLLETQQHYKIKYIIPFSIILLIIILNSIYLHFRLPVDFSITLFGLAAVAIYYTSICYVPNYLVKKTTSVVMDNINTGIIIMDDNDTCIYINDFVKKMLNVSSPDDSAVTEIIEKYSEGSALSEKAPFEHDIEHLQGSKASYYKFNFSFIGDQNRNFLGSYFLITDTTEENERTNREIFENTHDKLTGLYNKEYFYRKAEELLEKTEDQQYIMICSDINDFKLINDLYGIATGDRILKKYAEFLSSHTDSNEVYCRYEADKFALLCPKSSYREEKIIQLQNEVFQGSNISSLATYCNIGVYEIDDPNISISIMCDRAFSAIETIKNNYDVHIAWYDSKLRSSILREQELISQLSDAMDSNQIMMYLQPRASMDKKILGSEALVRWIHPENGIISPAEFIPIFEKQGYIGQLDKFIWRKACQKLYEWKEQGREDLYISINISPKDFYLLDVEDELTKLISEFNIQPKNLKLEITEGAIMIDIDRQIQIFENLRSKGFIIELDNFGSGYASLNMIKDVPVDVLKLDMKFLKVPKNPERGRIITRQIIDMAKNLGIQVLAEGVETLDELQFLKEAGCNMFQGFLLEAPIDIAKFERLYMN